MRIIPRQRPNFIGNADRIANERQKNRLDASNCTNCTRHFTSSRQRRPSQSMMRHEQISAKVQRLCCAAKRGRRYPQYTTALRDKSSGKRQARHYSERSGGCLCTLGTKQKKAIEDFNRAVELFPPNTLPFTTIGEIYCWHLDFMKKPTKTSPRAIALAPGYAAAYNNRAGAYMRLGNTNLAIRDYTHAIKLMPSNPPPHSQVAGGAHLTQGRPHAAIRDFFTCRWRGRTVRRRLPKSSRSQIRSRTLCRCHRGPFTCHSIRRCQSRSLSVARPRLPSDPAM